MRSNHSARIMLATALALGSGCYDGELLVHDAQSSAVSTRLAEVDLGRFKTTLPRDRRDNSLTNLEVHVFATVPRARVADIKKQLKLEEYRLRHVLLAAVRSVSSEELAEPSLAQLRRRIEHVVEEVLGDNPMKEIGFYEVKLQRR